MEPIKSLFKVDMASLSPEPKITRKQSVRPVILPLIYVPMPPTNEALYKAAVVQSDAVG